MKNISRTNIEKYADYQAEPTAWHEVTQAQINAFADCTLDHQFIHVDPEAAAKTPFGATIAHGFLSLSMLSHFAEQFSLVIDGTVMGINYGFDKVRFLNPVKVGSRIRAHATTLDIVEKSPGQFLSRTSVIIEIEGEEKPALSAIWLGMQIVA
ncbi:MaoC family dehydratase [Simiduia curdlanivorans]|uniref:MaoC family dehydratase n=1 Tax=Simiduia curdlanivorans TaxID=1492769 RepID=A0ABV8VC71_9GAMM|nr:MaoC family dehydratase [Simiduia curdlanivorans]MDN3639340.1 MaoC family dehydratase [Simiduia curdlanivorans]